MLKNYTARKTHRPVIEIIMGLYMALALPFLSETAYAKEKPELTIYTYESFASEWGPGPAIKTAFEKKCECVVNFVGLDSSIGILGRLQIEGRTSKADIALGLDTNLIQVARETNLFADHNVATSGRLGLPEETERSWSDSKFLPFDWGYFAFVYDTTKLAEPPRSMQALLDAPDSLRVVIQDPRTATPGLGLMLWINAIYGDKAPEAWEKLAPKIVTVTKGWWDAYSMFLEGEADMVLSYSTSPAYHRIVEEKTQYQAAGFTEGHYMQIEIAGMLEAAPNPELARRFMDFILDPQFQSIIPTTNWMYPAGKVELPAGFEGLIKPSTSLLFTPAEVAENRKKWTEDWRLGLSR